MSMIGLFTAVPQATAGTTVTDDPAAAEGFGGALQDVIDALAHDTNVAGEATEPQTGQPQAAPSQAGQSQTAPSQAALSSTAPSLTGAEPAPGSRAAAWLPIAPAGDSSEPAAGSGSVSDTDAPLLGTTSSVHQNLAPAPSESGSVANQPAASGSVASSVPPAQRVGTPAPLVELVETSVPAAEPAETPTPLVEPVETPTGNPSAPPLAQHVAAPRIPNSSPLAELVKTSVPLVELVETPTSNSNATSALSPSTTAPPATSPPSAGVQVSASTVPPAHPFGTASSSAASTTPVSGAGSTSEGATAITSQVTAAAAPANAPAPSVTPVSTIAAPSPAPSAPLNTQLARPIFSLAAAGAGEHTMTVSVTPDSLGPVTVRAHVGAEGVRVELFAPNDLGRDAIRAIMTDLRRDLAGTGLGGNLTLSSQNQPTAQAGADGSAAGHPGSERGSAQRTAAGEADDARAVHTESPSEQLSGRPQLFGSTSTIDVLA